jgi:D-alanyl-D-alanine dipeptidase
MDAYPVKRLLLVLVMVGCVTDEPSTADRASDPPAEAPLAWLPIVGEYASGSDTVSILEDGGSLVLLRWYGEPRPMRALSDSTFAFEGEGGEAAVVGLGTGAVRALMLNGLEHARLTLGAEDGGTFRIEPLRPADELRAEALDASPPLEPGDFLPSDLVELVTLDETIRLDIRYASTDNFMGEVFYSAPRAFLQRPAAEALVRAQEWLGARGYGLLVHDGYRPWYVTKMFWDATPEDLRVFVADPTSGSRHNRGAAVDLTLYSLSTGEPITMTGGYDEFSPRSFPDYPGGTSRQRWHRALLREAMEREGFDVYEAEWWHFDHEDWRSYRIGNQRFEELGTEVVRNAPSS